MVKNSAMEQNLSPLNKLLIGCRRQDRKSQQALYNMLAAKLFAICKRYTSSTIEAEDLLQESFLLIFRRIDQYTGQGAFEGWAHRITVNLALSKYRDDKRRPQYCEFDMQAHNKVFYTNDAPEVDHLLKMIHNLPAHLKLPFNLYAIEGYSHLEIGDMLGISEMQSRTSTCRARSILRKKLLSYDHQVLQIA